MPEDARGEVALEVQGDTRERVLALPKPWCWRALPRADVRAIDAQGAVWSVVGQRLTKELTGQTWRLGEEIPCLLRGAWAMEFARDGSAFLLADSRFHVRSGEETGFAVTPLCTDLQGAPWSRRADGVGWAFVSHRSRAVEPTLMFSHAPGGGTGWYAVTGMDGSTRAVVLDAAGSMITLTGEGHLVFVDRVNVVAGEVMAVQRERFDGLTRTAAGVTAFRDDLNGRRVIVYTERVSGPYVRTEGRRPSGSTARRVFRLDLARFLAVTEQTLELSEDRGVTWVQVYEGTALERPQMGWLPGHHPAVATRDGIASDDCGAVTP